MVRLVLFAVCLVSLVLSTAMAQQEPPFGEVLDKLRMDFSFEDEILIEEPYRGIFIKTGDVVEVVLIAKYSFGTMEEVCQVRAGYYLMGDPEALKPLFTCGVEANDKTDITGLPADPRGPYIFDPGTKPFGLYVQSANFNKEFDLNGETVYTQDGLNKRITRFGKDVHKARIYPYKTKDDRIGDWYVVCWEFSTNNDFQDLILVIRGVELLQPPPREKKHQSVEGMKETVTMR